MAVDHQPTFNRTSLNILILVCIVLILIFGHSAQDSSEIKLPPVPKLNTSIWKTDSGASVWFNPKLDEHIYIQLDFLAGFAFNQSPYPAGTSQLLVSLLNAQAETQKLPIHFRLSMDFIEASIQLSTEPLTMKKQLTAITQLIYRPTLSNQQLQNAKLIIHSPIDDVWQQAFANHIYAGPKKGTSESVSGIHRALVQKFQQAYLHPKRLYAGISGNINETAAQVIMERLLPAKAHEAASLEHTESSATHYIAENNYAVLALPGSYESIEDIAQQKMALCLLQVIHPNQISMQEGNLNNALVIEQWDNLTLAMDTEPNSDMMRQAKRQCIKQAFEQTQTARALSQFLAWLNRYHLPSNFLHKQFAHIEGWQLHHWRTLQKNWFKPSE